MKKKSISECVCKTEKQCTKKEEKTNLSNLAERRKRIENLMLEFNEGQVDYAGDNFYNLH